MKRGQPALFFNLCGTFLVPIKGGMDMQGSERIDQVSKVLAEIAISSGACGVDKDGRIILPPPGGGIAVVVGDLPVVAISLNRLMEVVTQLGPNNWIGVAADEVAYAETLTTAPAVWLAGSRKAG